MAIFPDDKPDTEPQAGGIKKPGKTHPASKEEVLHDNVEISRPVSSGIRRMDRNNFVAD